MQVLVTGGGGYIGSVLVPRLLQEGYKVKVLDRFFFGKEILQSVSKNPNLTMIQDDTRWFDGKILKNVDVVMDLAALSNDPSGELEPQKTLDINYKGRARVARLSEEAGVKRYILASSCSIYGFRDGLLNEQSPVNPLTTYAKANRLAEISAKKLASEKFIVTLLRFATVYGYSPRMRFDLAVNGMVLGFFKSKQIPIMRDGTQWRPFIHVKDVAGAYVKVIKSPADKINGEIFNVGSDEQNYQILPLAKEVAKSIKISFKKKWYGDPDSRSYKISFKKIKDTLGYKTKFTVGDGSREIYSALQIGTLTDSIKTKTVEWYKYLLESKKIVESIVIKNTIL
ncbi:MAG: NAD-dependent dehydratase [Thaumarchaeota archaeon 13_1_40CM_38_12]|nr:MAG: NAD-dependent dehydratase [Thaumarchaeota archaeon 13_1_40CM_38_12]